MELWKSVINYAGVYEVSNKGEIRRCDNYHKSPRKYLRPAKNHHGYLNVSLSKDGVCKTFFVHKIVCESFNGVRKKGMTINHINGNKLDNRPENLEYMSHYDNIQHSIHIINTFIPSRASGIQNGAKTHPEKTLKGVDVATAKLTESKVLHIREKLAQGVKQRVIADIIGISQTQIWRIKNNLSWRHVI